MWKYLLRSITENRSIQEKEFSHFLPFKLELVNSCDVALEARLLNDFFSLRRNALILSGLYVGIAIGLMLRDSF